MDGQLLVCPCLDDFLGRRIHRDVQVAGLQAGHPGLLVGHRAQHHFIEVHRALPVGAVAHEHDLRATPPFLEDERARTDRVGHVVFTMLLGRGGRHDHARGVGQGGEEVRRGRLHLEHDFQRSGRLDAADARQVGGPAVAVLGVHQALEVFDDRGRIEGRLVMELHAAAQLQLEPGGVGRGFELLGEVGQQVALGADVEQGVVDGDAGLLVVERRNHQRVQPLQVALEGDRQRASAHGALGADARGAQRQRNGQRRLQHTRPQPARISQIHVVSPLCGQNRFDAVTGPMAASPACGLPTLYCTASQSGTIRT